MNMVLPWSKRWQNDAAKVHPEGGMSCEANSSAGHKWRKTQKGCRQGSQCFYVSVSTYNFDFPQRRLLLIISNIS